jgi:Uma2 family endonuclease
MHIEVFRRRKGKPWQWEMLTEPGEELHLKSVGLTLSLAQVYRRVKFDQRSHRRR